MPRPRLANGIALIPLSDQFVRIACLMPQSAVDPHVLPEVPERSIGLSLSLSDWPEVSFCLRCLNQSAGGLLGR